MKSKKITRKHIYNTYLNGLIKEDVMPFMLEHIIKQEFKEEIKDMEKLCIKVMSTINAPKGCSFHKLRISADVIKNV